jgi:membrane protein
VALVFTTAAMIGMIERAFNQIWRVKRPRPLVQRVLIYWAWSPSARCCSASR